MEAMDKWVQIIKSKLGYPVVDIYTTDEAIHGFIRFAIDKISAFVEEAEYITVQGPTVDMRQYNVFVVLGVYKTQMTSNNASLSYVDEFAMLNYAPFTAQGGNMELLLMRNLFKSEMDSMVPVDYELIDGMLYLSGIYGFATVKAVTEKSLFKMSPTYQNWIIDYALAMTKQSEGNIRGKFKVTGSPVEMDGSALISEGREEQQKLEEKLGVTIGAWYVTR